MLADQCLDGVGIVRGYEGPHEAPHIENEPDVLLRPLWVQACPIARVRRTPNPPFATEGTHLDTPDRADGAVRDAFGAPGEVVPADLYAVIQAFDPAITVSTVHDPTSRHLLIGRALLDRDYLGVASDGRVGDIGSVLGQRRLESSDPGSQEQNETDSGCTVPSIMSRATSDRQRLFRA